MPYGERNNSIVVVISCFIYIFILCTIILNFRFNGYVTVRPFVRQAHSLAFSGSSLPGF